MPARNIIAAFLLTIVGVVVLLHAIPMIAMLFLHAEKTRMLSEVEEELLDSIQPGSAVAAGWEREELRELERRLLDSSALPGESARNTRSVHVAFVSFGRKLPARPTVDVAAPPPESAFAPVRLDVTELRSSAGVMISDSPIVWDLVGTNPFQRGRLGFEGPAPVDVNPLPQGFIAGLRIGAKGVLRVSDASRLRESRRIFCRSMESWADHFAVDLSKIKVWQVRLSSQEARLELRDAGLTAPSGRVRSKGTAAIVCSG